MVSRSSMTLTEKCLPTSRRNSIVPSGAVQVRLFSTIAPVGEASKSTNRSSCPRMRSDHCATVSAVFNVRSPVSGIADHSGGSAGKNNRAVAGALEALQGEQGDKVAGVQARCCRIETGVDGHRRLRGGRPERADIGGLCDKSAPGQFVENRRAHGSIFPHRMCSVARARR